MRRPFIRAAAVVLVVVSGCGGKIASEGSSSGGGASSSSSTGSSSSSSGSNGNDLGYPEPGEPPPGSETSSGLDPVATCPRTPPADGELCSWDYGLPCHYAVQRGDVCGVQCTCFGGPGAEANHWTCFDVACEP